MTSDNAALIARLRGPMKRVMVPMDLGDGAAPIMVPGLGDLHEAGKEREEAASALEAAERRIRELLTERDADKSLLVRASKQIAELYTERDASAAEAVALREGLDRIKSLAPTEADKAWGMGAPKAYAHAARIANETLSITPFAAAQRVRAMQKVVDAAIAYWQDEWNGASAAEISGNRTANDYPDISDEEKALLDALAALDHPEAGKDAT